MAGWRRSRVVTFTAIRLRGPEFKFENENVCFRRTPAVVKACHPCRVRPIKTPLYKPEYLSYCMAVSIDVAFKQTSGVSPLCHFVPHFPLGLHPCSIAMSALSRIHLCTCRIAPDFV